MAENNTIFGAPRFGKALLAENENLKAEVERLRAAQNKTKRHLLDEIHRRDEEIARLWEALEPFAAFCEVVESRPVNDGPVVLSGQLSRLISDPRIVLTVSDFQKARATFRGEAAPQSIIERGESFLMGSVEEIDLDSLRRKGDAPQEGYCDTCRYRNYDTSNPANSRESEGGNCRRESDVLAIEETDHPHYSLGQSKPCPLWGPEADGGAGPE